MSEYEGMQEDDPMILSTIGAYPQKIALPGSYGSDFADAAKFLEGAKNYYPNFESWLSDRVVAESVNGRRKVFVARRDDGRIVGAAIAKRGAETKLCTLRICPTARHLGLAQALAKAAFHWMREDRPLFTVPEELMLEFSPLLYKWKFRLEQELPGYYRPGMQEYVFNGKLCTH